MFLKKIFPRTAGARLAAMKLCPPPPPGRFRALSKEQAVGGPEDKLLQEAWREMGD